MTPIDFHDSSNSDMYAGREASLGWRITITSIRDPLGLAVLDIGCGGGIYTRALAEMGAATVTGIDSSAPMLDAARITCASLESVDFVQAMADAVPLPDQAGDFALARGLIHHLPNLASFATEVHRLLTPEGTLIVQDRTPEDIGQASSPENLRGYFFERYPHLRDIDTPRRRDAESVAGTLRAAGFDPVTISSIEEIRTIHSDREALVDDLRARRGRSILHELDDAQLEDLIVYISDHVPATGPIIERDQWTLWSATKPAVTA